MKVSKLGEQRLIAEIRRWLGTACPPPPAGIGDDCAVLPLWPPARLITVDPVVDGRHFDAAVKPADAGAKLLKRNLSDIAAMGGRAHAAVISLALPDDFSVRWLEGFYRGLAAVARKYRVQVVGGDVTRTTGPFSAHLTLLGGLPQGRALTRGGAKIGDALYVTGKLGASLASGHHCSFTPRLQEGEWLASRPEVRAMIDISDGLAKDVHALMPRGGAPAITSAALPLRPGATVEAALTDGEDYELLFAFRAVPGGGGAEFAAAFRKAFPRTGLTRIGVVAPARKRPAGAADLSRLKGYEHFRR